MRRRIFRNKKAAASPLEFTISFIPITVVFVIVISSVSQTDQHLNFIDVDQKAVEISRILLSTDSNLGLRVDNDELLEIPDTAIPPGEEIPEEDNIDVYVELISYETPSSPGDKISVSFNVGNNASVILPADDVQYRVSIGSFEESKFLDEIDPNLNPLQPGATVKIDHDVTIPDSYGTHYLYIEVIPSSSQDDKDLMNNQIIEKIEINIDSETYDPTPPTVPVVGGPTKGITHFSGGEAEGGIWLPGQGDIIPEDAPLVTLQPYFGSGSQGVEGLAIGGDKVYAGVPTSTNPDWGDWIEISDDIHAPQPFTMEDVMNLECYVRIENFGEGCGSTISFLECQISKIEIKVEFSLLSNTYYFDDYINQGWQYPEFMADGDDKSYAFSDQIDVCEVLINNSYKEGSLGGLEGGTITAVYIRAHGSFYYQYYGSDEVPDNGEYIFSAYSEDVNNDMIQYGWDFNYNPGGSLPSQNILPDKDTNVKDWQSFKLMTPPPSDHYTCVYEDPDIEGHDGSDSYIYTSEIGYMELFELNEIIVNPEIIPTGITIHGVMSSDMITSEQGEDVPIPENYFKFLIAERNAQGQFEILESSIEYKITTYFGSENEEDKWLEYEIDFCTLPLGGDLTWQRINDLLLGLKFNRTINEGGDILNIYCTNLWCEVHLYELENIGDPDWSEYSPSGSRNDYLKYWNSPGTYYFRVKARDNSHPPLESGWSQVHSISISINHMPSDPVYLKCYDENVIPPEETYDHDEGVEYTWYTLATDPDPDEDLYFQFDFNEDITNWIGPADSGEEMYKKYTWPECGIMVVKVRVRDQWRWTSEWLSIDIQVNGEDCTQSGEPIPPPICFLAGTKIRMADKSTKNIEDIEIGDLVKSRDYENDIDTVGEVVEVFHHSPEEMTDYYLIINNELKVTPNHPIRLNNKWVPAGEIKIGDFFGEEITSIEKIYKKVPTYNFEVKDYHNYIIVWNLKDGLVHNKEAQGGDKIKCFSEDTKIVMADGKTKNIKDIKIGDKIKSFNPLFKMITTDTVTNIFYHSSEEMLSDYYILINNEISITPEHPVYINGKWIKADNLEIGNDLAYGEISSIKRIYTRIPTYNFETKIYHNYIVKSGKNLIIAHNDGYYYITGNEEEDDAINKNRVTNDLPIFILNMQNINKLKNLEYSYLKSSQFDLPENYDFLIKIGNKDYTFLYKDDGSGTTNWDTANDIASYTENVIVLYNGYYIQAELQVKVARW